MEKRAYQLWEFPDIFAVLRELDQAGDALNLARLDAILHQYTIMHDSVYWFRPNDKGREFIVNFIPIMGNDNALIWGELNIERDNIGVGDKPHWYICTVLVTDGLGCGIEISVDNCFEGVSIAVNYDDGYNPDDADKAYLAVHQLVRKYKSNHQKAE